MLLVRASSSTANSQDVERVEVRLLQPATSSPGSRRPTNAFPGSPYTAPLTAGVRPKMCFVTKSSRIQMPQRSVQIRQDCEARLASLLGSAPHLPAEELLIHAAELRQLVVPDRLGHGLGGAEAIRPPLPPRAEGDVCAGKWYPAVLGVEGLANVGVEDGEQRAGTALSAPAGGLVGLSSFPLTCQCLEPRAKLLHHTVGVARPRYCGSVKTRLNACAAALDERGRTLAVGSGLGSRWHASAASHTTTGWAARSEQAPETVRDPVRESPILGQRHGSEICLPTQVFIGASAAPPHRVRQRPGPLAFFWCRLDSELRMARMHPGEEPLKWESGSPSCRLTDK